MDYMKKKSFLRVAEELSNISRCVYDKNAAVLVKDGVVIGTGVNGTLQGMINCDEYFMGEEQPVNHEIFSAKYESEAEMNAVLLCSRNGISCRNATICTWKMPRANIIKYLAIAGIVEICFKVPLSNKQDINDTVRICEMMNIKIVRIE